MADNITPDTDFSNVTIKNDYPCLVGGSWTAKLDDDGNTIYTNGKETHNGPVNLIGGSLTVANGAVVTGLVAVNNAIVVVQSGGALESSDIFGSSVTFNINTTSEDNNFVSTHLTFPGNTTSTNDTFYYPGVTSTTSGTLELSQLPSGTSTSFQTSSGNTSIGHGAGVTSNLTLYSPNFPDISANNPGAPSSGSQIISLNASSQFGNISLAPTTDYSDGNFTLTNDMPVYIGGTWTASVGSDGQTTYTGVNVTNSSTGEK